MECCASLRRIYIVWKDYIERIMHKGNDWSQSVKTDATEGQ